jgi:hypothetical protein
VTLDELPASAKEAGWSIDPLKVPLALGDKKQITVQFTSPSAPHAGMAAYFGRSEYLQLQLGALLKGGLPAPAAGPEGQRVLLVFRVLMKPGPRPEDEPMQASVVSAAAAPVEGEKKDKKK